MTPQTAWLLAISAVIIAALIGFFIGRQFGAGRSRIDELEAELSRKKDEADRYRDEVAAHFDQSATLFVSMAGSYKALFEHLSAGYETLAPASSRERFQQRVEALQVGDGSAPEADGRPAADDYRDRPAASRAAGAAAAAGVATVAAGAAMAGAEGEDGEDGEEGEEGEEGAAPARTVAGDAGIDEVRREEGAGVALDPVAEEVSGERAGRGEEAK